MSTKKQKSTAQVIEGAAAETPKKASVETVPVSADKKAPKEKEAAKPVEEKAVEKPVKAPAPVAETKDTVLNAAAATSVELVKPKPKKEEPVVSDDTNLALLPARKKTKNNLLIVDDEVIELKPLGQLVGLLGFVNEGTINPIDLENAKHVILKDTLFVLNNGSSVTISDVTASENYIRYAKAGDFSVGSLPIVVLDASKLSTTYWPRVKGKNKLFSSSITGNGDLFADIFIEDAVVVSTSIRGGNISLTRTDVHRSSINSPNVNIIESYLNESSVNVKGICRISDFSGSKGVNLYGYTSVEIVPNHPIYTPDLTISSVYGHDENGKVALNIVSRVDYGHFNAVKPLGFNRCNAADIVVGGTFFENEEFEQLYKRYSADLGQHATGGFFSGNLGSGAACDCMTEEHYLKLVRSVYRLAMGKPSGTYRPDRSNTLENGIIMNLLDQIRSRMNLYKQVNSVVN